MSGKKDIDYLFISAKIKAMENLILTRERMERMLEAKTVEDAAKVLTECGYGDFTKVSVATIEEKLHEMRTELYQDLYSDMPEVGIIDVFRIKFDYHNIKVILKSNFDDDKCERLLVDAGTIPVAELKDMLFNMDSQQLSSSISYAVVRAREVLAVTYDPQLADLILDKACYAQMLAAAEKTGSKFLICFVRISIDAINLRTAIRGLRMNKDMDFIKNTLIPGGEISPDSVILAAGTGGNFEALYAYGELAEAAEVGSSIIKGGRMTEFEKLCDNAIMKYLDGAKFTAFGEQAVVGYLYAKEAEFSAVRIIMTGRLAGIEPDVIRERLREAYV